MLQFSREVYDDIVDHADSSGAEEGCGVLAGESADLAVVGFYSHPTGPTAPSETDRDRATWPNRSYVLCAVDGYPFVGSLAGRV